MLNTVVRSGAAVAFEVWQARKGKPLSMHANSATLMVSVGLTAAFGQLSWLVAARVSTPQDVGRASEMIAAMALCAQIALLGLGAAVVVRLPTVGAGAAHYLRALTGLAGVAGAVCGVVLLATAALALPELSEVTWTPVAGGGFVLACVCFTLWLLFDWTSVGLRRSDHSVARATSAGVARVVVLGVLALGATRLSAAGIFGAWLLGCVVACGLGATQLARVLPGFRPWPVIDRGVLTDALRLGLPNHALTLVMLAPGLVLPIVVAEQLSTETNAYWYVAWMIASLAMVIPASMGSGLFAEVSNHERRLHSGTRACIRSSLLLGVLAAVAVDLLASFILSLLGDAYRDGATLPLRLLVWAVVPAAFIETYVTVCRITRRRREAVVMQTLVAATAIVGAGIVAPTLGLVGVAIGWLVLEVVAGLWCLWRLTRLTELA